MLAPRRLDTPILVPDSQLLHKTTFISNEEPNGLRRNGMVEGDVEWGRQFQEIRKENIQPASSTGRKLLPTLSPAPSIPQVVTFDTVLSMATTSAVLISEGGRRVETETLPVHNKNKPNITEPDFEAQTFPGVNQDASNTDESSKSALPSVAANSEGPSTAPAITVDKPLPGQNQVIPILDELAPLPSLLSTPSLSIPSEILPAAPLFHRPTTTSRSLDEASISLVQSMATSNFLPTLKTPTQTPPSTSISSANLLLVTSFVTITRSEQGKEALPVTLAQSTSVSTLIASAHARSTDVISPQAIVVAQSFTRISTSTAAIAAATILPEAVTSERNGSNLHPTARTLLILFIILGDNSVLVAIIVLIIIKSHKQGTQARQQTIINQTMYAASNNRIGVTTHISANSNDNPFLTPSEKAIIDRAASPRAYDNSSNSLSFPDAISTFIKKSRRKTYKISP